MLTTAGKDFASDCMFATSGRPAVAQYMAISANATAPAAGDTTLTGEIATAGGGLVRKAFTYGHTPGASTSTASATFTANGSDSLGTPVDVAKMALFNAASSGAMPWETLLSTTARISVAGDAVGCTDTITWS